MVKWVAQSHRDSDCELGLELRFPESHSVLGPLEWAVGVVL